MALPNEVNYNTHGASAVPSQSVYDSFVTGYDYFFYRVINGNLNIIRSNKPFTVWADANKTLYNTDNTQSYTTLYQDDTISSGSIAMVNATSYGEHFPPEPIVYFTPTYIVGTYITQEQSLLQSTYQNVGWAYDPWHWIHVDGQLPTLGLKAYVAVNANIRGTRITETEVQSKETYVNQGWLFDNWHWIMESGDLLPRLGLKGYVEVPKAINGIRLDLMTAVSPSTYKDVGWDFSNTMWQINKGYTYPYLSYDMNPNVVGIGEYIKELMARNDLKTRIMIGIGIQ